MVCSYDGQEHSFSFIELEGPTEIYHEDKDGKTYVLTRPRTDRYMKVICVKCGWYRKVLMKTEE